MLQKPVKKCIGILLTLCMVVSALFGNIGYQIALADTNNLTIHFKKPSNWKGPNLYYYNDNAKGPNWPGTQMQAEGNDWYTYTINNWSNAKVIFNDGSNQIPGRNQSGVYVDKESWYKDGKLYSSNPEQQQPKTTITIYVEKPDGWDAPWIWYDSDLSTSAWDTTALKSAPGDMVNYRTGWYKKEILTTGKVQFLFNSGDWSKKLTSNGNDFTTTTDIWITKDGKTYTADPVKQNPITVKSIDLTGNDSVNVGDSINLSAAVNYSDGTKKIESVNWSASSNGATLSANAGTNVSLKGVTAGSVTVYAEKDGVKASKVINVNNIPVTVKSIDLTGNDSVKVDSSIDFTATVNYSDGSKKTENVNWSISNDNAILSTTAGSVASLKGAKEGSVAVYAEKGGVKASKTITVLGNVDPLTGIKVHFYSPWSGAKIYYWAVKPTATTVAWPGTDMTSEGNGWYGYSLQNATSSNIIFDYNGSQTTDLTRTNGEWWYKDNVWYDRDPDIDVTAPTVTTTPNAGSQEPTSISVSLNVKDDKDSQPKAYYTVDGTTPVVGKNLYSEPIKLTSDGTIKAIAIDKAGNQSKVYSFDFKLGQDVTAPVVTTSVEAKKYTDAQSVKIQVKDNKDPNPKVYYSVDGKDPVIDSAHLYKGEAINITKTTTLATLAVDNAGNKGIQYFRYVIGTDDKSDFRDESIYFVITTRFYDGDSSNNVHCWDDAKAKNPDTDPAWRGDFKGLAEKLDYIKALGFSAIWITPPVKNVSGYDYHGYHAINFQEIDPRYKSAEDASAEESYQKFIDAAHAKGIKVIQDIVLNHTGNFGEENLYPLFKRKDVTPTLNESMANVIENIAPAGKLPSNYDTLTPANQFQARIKAMRDGIDTDLIYHHHEFKGGWEQYEVQIGSIAGDCQDLNTENPVVEKYLVDSYKKYINMGVDAFRIDTVKHVSRLTFNNAILPQLKAAGGDSFYMFGEVCTRWSSVWNADIPAISTPFYTWKESKTYPWGDMATNTASAEQAYKDNQGGTSGSQPTSNNTFLNGNDYHTPDYSKSSGMGVIDFPMHWNFRDARSAFGVATGGDKWYNDATWNVTYVDSHDDSPDQAPMTQRFAGTQDTWAENLDLMFAFRGIPCLYYGSEIEFQKGKTIDPGPDAPLSQTGRAYFGDKIEGTVTATDFGKYTNATGAVADTLNYPLAQHIRRLNLIRRAIPALRKGEYSTDGISGDGMAFKRRYTDKATGVDSFCVVTISGGANFTGIPNGTYVDAVTGDKKVVSNGSLSIACSGKGNMRVYVLELPGNSAPGKVGDDGTYLK